MFALLSLSFSSSSSFPFTYNRSAIMRLAHRTNFTGDFSVALKEAWAMAKEQMEMAKAMVEMAGVSGINMEAFDAFRVEVAHLRKTVWSCECEDALATTLKDSVITELNNRAKGTHRAMFGWEKATELLVA